MKNNFFFKKKLYILCSKKASSISQKLEHKSLNMLVAFILLPVKIKPPLADTLFY